MYSYNVSDLESTATDEKYIFSTLLSPDDIPDMILENTETMNILTRSINKLKPIERQIIILHDMLEYRLLNISKLYGCTEGNICLIRKKALSELKDILIRAGIDRKGSNGKLKSNKKTMSNL